MSLACSVGDRGGRAGSERSVLAPLAGAEAPAALVALAQVPLQSLSLAAAAGALPRARVRGSHSPRGSSAPLSNCYSSEQLKPADRLQQRVSAMPAWCLRPSRRDRSCALEELLLIS